jgi:predicted nucleic acid-binding protein
MLILLDTNILLRLVQPEQQPLHDIANTAITTLTNSNNQLLLSPQVLQEFYSVATRPVTARGGLGLKPNDALRYFSHFETMAELLPELPLHQSGSA